MIYSKFILPVHLSGCVDMHAVVTAKCITGDALVLCITMFTGSAALE